MLDRTPFAGNVSPIRLTLLSAIPRPKPKLCQYIVNKRHNLRCHGKFIQNLELGHLNTRNHNSLHAPTADKVCEAVDRWASLHKGQGNERNQLDSGPRFDGQIIKTRTTSFRSPMERSDQYGQYGGCGEWGAQARQTIDLSRSTRTAARVFRWLAKSVI